MMIATTTSYNGQNLTNNRKIVSTESAQFSTTQNTLKSPPRVKKWFARMQVPVQKQTPGLRISHLAIIRSSVASSSSTNRTKAKGRGLTHQRVSTIAMYRTAEVVGCTRDMTCNSIWYILHNIEYVRYNIVIQWEFVRYFRTPPF